MGASLAHQHHQIGRMDIRPFDRQRAQAARLVQVRHAIPTPVVAYGKDFEGPTFQRMERMRDREYFWVIVATLCNARFSPKQKSRTPSSWHNVGS